MRLCCLSFRFSKILDSLETSLKPYCIQPQAQAHSLVETAEEMQKGLHSAAGAGGGALPALCDSVTTMSPDVGKATVELQQQWRRALACVSVPDGHVQPRLELRASKRLKTAGADGALLAELNAQLDSSLHRGVQIGASYRVIIRIVESMSSPSPRHCHRHHCRLGMTINTSATTTVISCSPSLAPAFNLYHRCKTFAATTLLSLPSPRVMREML